MKNPITAILAVLLIILLAFFFGREDVNPPVVTPTPTPVTEITWDSSKISTPMVQIIILNEVNNDPHTYELVRHLATSTPNDGLFGLTEVLPKGTLIEIGCAYEGERPPVEGCYALPIMEIN